MTPTQTELWEQSQDDVFLGNMQPEPEVKTEDEEKKPAEKDGEEE